MKIRRAILAGVVAAPLFSLFVAASPASACESLGCAACRATANVYYKVTGRTLNCPQ